MTSHGAPPGNAPPPQPGGAGTQGATMEKLIAKEREVVVNAMMEETTRQIP